MQSSDHGVTAVITTHRREPHIVERALRSALAQTYPHMEIVVVDDSPDDYALRGAVADMVRGYEAQGVRYIQHERCMGAGAARNTGLAQAHGEFIAYLDDDDEWLPEKTERQAACFTVDDIALVYCDHETVIEETGQRRIHRNRDVTSQLFDELMLENFVGSTSFPLLRRSALEAIGGFDETLESAEDLDVWLSLARFYKFYHVSDVLAVYHVYSGERITSNPRKVIAGFERMNEKYRDYISQNRYVLWKR